MKLEVALINTIKETVSNSYNRQFLVRVISWIVCYAPEKGDPLNHTKEQERSPEAISSLTQALKWVG